MKKLIAHCSLLALVAIGSPNLAFSQSLETCFRGRACSCTVTPSHDACDGTVWSNLTGTSPAALSTDADIVSGREGADLYIFADTDDINVAFLPTPSGSFDDIAALDGYLSSLLGTTVDLATEGVWYYEQHGDLARLSSASAWASEQLNGNLLFAAIHDASGVLEIDSVDYELTFSTGCVTESDVEFSGVQCTSMMRHDSVVECGATLDCPNKEEFWVTKLNNFALTSGPYVVYDRSLSPAGDYHRRQVLATVADMTQLYFDISGDAVSKQEAGTAYDRDAIQLGSFGHFGACGFGQAERLTREILPITSGGEAPVTAGGCLDELDSFTP